MKTELSYGVPNQKAFDDLVELLEREYFALRKRAKKNGVKRKNIEIHISKGISSILFCSTVCGSAVKNSIIFTKNGKRYKVPVIIDEDIPDKQYFNGLHLTDIYMFDPAWIVQE